jgi:hypothetical protein
MVAAPHLGADRCAHEIGRAEDRGEVCADEIAVKAGAGLRHFDRDPAGGVYPAERADRDERVADFTPAAVKLTNDFLGG